MRVGGRDTGRVRWKKSKRVSASGEHLVGMNCLVQAPAEVPHFPPKGCGPMALGFFFFFQHACCPRLRSQVIEHDVALRRVGALSGGSLLMQAVDPFVRTGSLEIPQAFGLLHRGRLQVSRRLCKPLPAGDSELGKAVTAFGHAKTPKWR